MHQDGGEPEGRDSGGVMLTPREAFVRLLQAEPPNLRALGVSIVVAIAIVFLLCSA